MSKVALVSPEIIRELKNGKLNESREDGGVENYMCPKICGNYRTVFDRPPLAPPPSLGSTALPWLHRPPAKDTYSFQLVSFCAREAQVPVGLCLLREDGIISHLWALPRLTFFRNNASGVIAIFTTYLFNLSPYGKL